MTKVMYGVNERTETTDKAKTLSIISENLAQKIFFSIFCYLLGCFKHTF